MGIDNDCAEMPRPGMVSVSHPPPGTMPEWWELEYESALRDMREEWERWYGEAYDER